MSSSDDDFSWMPKNNANKGQNAMMAARREALQRQREQQQHPQPGRLGAPTADASPAPAAAANESPKQAGGLAQEGSTKLDSVEALQLEIETKKKLLQSTKEREQALLNKWRASKGQKTAEIHQIESQLRTLWSSVEDEKSVSETKVREAQDAYEKELRSERQKLEQEVKNEYAPQIEALKAKLEEKKKEEDKLKSLLNMEDETQDVIQQAVGSALVKVLDKIQNVFNQRADETEEWDQSLKDLIRHEVRSSFAVSMDSEAQTERTEYARQFEEMLKFWKTAELEERERVTKMDEMLLTDLQSMAEQDIARLHSEEQMMEELYLQSRENWALEHQKLLSKEVETAMKRRQEELDEQRSIRHQLHVDRVQDIEQRHKEQLELEGQLHEKAMAQLREHFAREEQLQSDRHRIAMATEQDVVKASASLYHIIENIENVMQSLLTYQRAIDEKGTHLEGAKVKMLEEQEKKLQEIKQLASSQYVSLEAENHKLGEALQALMLVKDKVEHQLQDEAQWLTEQEVKYKRNQEEWEKEYRRWTRTVQEQRKLGEQRFSEALLSLQGSVTQLSQEEKDILREEAELKSAFNDIHNTTEKEIVYLEGKQGTLIQKQEAMADTLADLERQKKDATQHWKQLQVDKSSLNKAREELAEEELRLSEMVQSLEFAKCQIEAMKRQTAEVVGFKENLSRHIPDPQSVTPPVAPRSKPTRDKKKERLPQKVLQDLRRQLDILPPDYTNIMHRDMEKGVAPIQHKTSRKKRVEYRDPNSVPQSDSYPTNSSNIDYSPSTITNFTNLVNFSDIDSTSPFL